MIYKDKGELEKALEYQLKSLEILMNKFPNGHPNLDVCIRNLDQLQFYIKNAGRIKLLGKLPSPLARIVSRIPGFLKYK